MFSTHYYELPDRTRSRYKQKMEKAGLVDDPYFTREQGIQSKPWQNWPRVEYPDMYNYLIQTPSTYTGESLRAYKSLDGYNFCVNGWVSNVLVFPIPRTSCKIISASVKHSQKLSAAPLTPWVAANMNGTVVCAHCTCMAGLGEACAHIAALLFTLERNTQHQNQTACTSLPCSWLPPSYQNVPYAEVAKIDFTTPQLSRKRSRSELNGNQLASDTSQPVIRPPSHKAVEDLYKNLFKAEKAVVLSLVPEYSDQYVPLNASGILPKPLTHLFDMHNLNLSYSDLLKKSIEVFEKYTISSDMAK